MQKLTKDTVWSWKEKVKIKSEVKVHGRGGGGQQDLYAHKLWYLQQVPSLEQT